MNGLLGSVIPYRIGKIIRSRRSHRRHPGPPPGSPRLTRKYRN